MLSKWGDNVEETGCLICGSDSAAVILDKLSLVQEQQGHPSCLLKFRNEPANYRHVCCMQCGFIYITPRLTEEETKEFYKQQYREIYGGPLKEDHISDTLRFHRTHLGIELFNAVNRYDHLEQLGFVREGIATLDVGSSLGCLPAYFQAKGCRAYGVELSQFGRYSKELFMLDTVFNVALEELQTDLKFNIVTICDALEHFSDPRRVLSIIRSLLVDDGIVLIEVPDVYRPRKGLVAFLSNAHLFTFSHNSILRLLAQSGFEVLHMDYGGSHMDMRVIARPRRAELPDEQPATPIDRAEELVDFLSRYERSYYQAMLLRMGRNSYENARMAIDSFLPDYRFIEYLEALKHIDHTPDTAEQLLIRYLETECNEEHLGLKGSVYALLGQLMIKKAQYDAASDYLTHAFAILPKIHRFPLLERLATKAGFNFLKFSRDYGLQYHALYANAGIVGLSLHGREGR